jgi:hypothetical protein
MSAATHIVTKPFEVKAGKRLDAGTEVDASEWRNTENLVKHRYLKPIPQNQTKQQGDNRQQKR